MLPGFNDILGVAVYERSRSPFDTLGGDGGGRYGVAYLLKDGGVTPDPGPAVLDVADRLITYLDCESVQFDTVFIDGGIRTRTNSPSVATDGNDVTYVKGADLTTGTRIVVEREKCKRSSVKLVGTKRSHFRRGFFRRQRIGSRDDWHYEMRWIKPTFVHGGQAIITERKVKRVVL